MTEVERRSFLLHARLPGFARRVQQAREGIATALQTTPHWYVAFSGGKDSTVTLDLVLRQQSAIPAVFSDDEWWLPETERYLKSLQEQGVDLRWIRTNAVHASWFSTTGDFEGIPDYARRQGFTGCFLGLRKEESVIRRIGLTKRGALFFSQQDDAWNCTPLAHWSTRDIWAYIVSQKLVYNAAYDRLAEMGVPLERQRIGPLAVEKVLGYGQLALLKRGWPDLYNRFVARYPEASAYV